MSRKKEGNQSSMFQIRAWLEKADRDAHKLNTHQLLPIEIVQAAVERVEKKVEMQRKTKPKRLNILELPDDNYDFSMNAKQSVQKTKLARSKVNAKRETVLDSYEYQKRFFELDDYVHAVDSRPGPLKHQALRASKAISRIQPPAQGPFKFKKEKPKRISSFWNLVNLQEPKFLYENHFANKNYSPIIRKSSIDKIQELMYKRRIPQEMIRPRRTIRTPPDQPHVEFVYTKSKMRILDDVKTKAISKTNFAKAPQISPKILQQLEAQNIQIPQIPFLTLRSQQQTQTRTRPVACTNKKAVQFVLPEKPVNLRLQLSATQEVPLRPSNTVTDFDNMRPYANSAWSKAINSRKPLLTRDNKIKTIW